MKVFLKRNFIWKFSWKETLHERFPKKKTLNENFPKKKTLYERFSKKKTHLTSSSNPLPQVSHPILRSNNSFPTQYISIKQSRLDLVEVLNEITFWKKWWEYIAQIWWEISKHKWESDCVLFRRLFHSDQGELSSRHQPFRLWLCCEMPMKCYSKEVQGLKFCSFAS